MDAFEKQQLAQKLQQSDPNLYQELLNEAHNEVMDTKLEQIAEGIAGSSNQQRLRIDFVNEYRKLKSTPGTSDMQLTACFSKHRSLGLLDFSQVSLAVGE